MKIFIVIPLAIAIVAALGYSLCAAMGVDAHLREMILAAVAVCIGSELAFVPLFIVRGQNQASVSQAALIGTVIHMFACLVLGGSMFLIKSLQMGNPLTYWLSAFYLVTLLVLLAGLIRAIKVAPIATGVAKHA